VIRSRPLRVAIVGSGPGGFYAAESLLAAASPGAEVDMIEALPAPFGLVRYGVAPDHPKIKTIITRYEKTAEHPAFAFLGNTHVGRDISVAELRRFYDAVIFATAASAFPAKTCPAVIPLPNLSRGTTVIPIIKTACLICRASARS
jgi:ferredoxin--NADP+ reductase